MPMADMPLYANEKWIVSQLLKLHALIVMPYDTFQQMSNEEKEAYKERGNAFKQTDSFRQYRMVARQRPKKSRDYASETASGTVPPSSRNRVVMPRQQDSDAILSRIDFISKRDSDRRLLGAKLGWRMPNRQDVIEFEFYIAGVQWFYETDNREFPPCELALIKCSAQGGVLEILHYFIPASRFSCPCTLLSMLDSHSYVFRRYPMRNDLYSTETFNGHSRVTV